MIPLERLEGCWTVLRWFFWLAVLGTVVLACLPISCNPGSEPGKTRAKNDLQQTITAINGFRTEYGVYPLQSVSTDSDLLIDVRNQRDLYNVLQAIEQKVGTPHTGIRNKRAVIFFEGRKVRGKQGFGEDGTLHDPWGGAYQFLLDTNEDGKITIPPEWKQPDSGQEVERTVIGYSPGKTNKVGDDVTTW